MYIKIRPMIENLIDEPDFILHTTKSTFISHIQEEIKKKWNYPEYCQRLIYKGKHLSPHYRIINYDIRINDVIQLSIIKNVDMVENMCPDLVNVDSKFYKVGDLVDVRCDSYYAWWAGVIVCIKKHEATEFTKDMSMEDIERKFIFFICFDSPEKNNLIYVSTFDSIRPRSTSVYSFDELKETDVILVKCSWWSDVGFWYDIHIDGIDFENKIILGTLIFDTWLPMIPNIIINYKETKNIYKVLKHVFSAEPPPALRSPFDICETCSSIPTNRCYKCGCYICTGKNDPGAIVLCDDCDRGYHYYCLDPPLSVVPTETEWYCPNCINIPNIHVVGTTPEIDDKKLRMPAAYKDDNKVWGRGMACVGRTKECTIVPVRHFGPIPGIDVGIRWKFRIQASEAGVHRPPVAGIHGRDNDGAYSLVMSGGYEDDVDNGTEFIYTGSGGRDLSGNKRTADQSSDQVLTRNNKALALNCYAEFNNEIGAKSRNWKKGKPVRVCRSSKFAPFSKYAPKEGIRYDGIYKVVKYYKEQGKSGFFVWKYLMKRDDATPAPWQKKGQEFDIIYPVGYLEAKEAKLSQNGESSKKGVLSIKNQISNEGESSKPQETAGKANVAIPPLAPSKKGKGTSTKRSFKLEPEVEKLIKTDTLNVKLWEECAENIKLGKFQYIAKVQETFRCIVCQEVVFNPITTKCKHNTCKECLKQSFDADIFECPYCRNQLGENYKMLINKKLSKILLLLLPGYAQYR